MITLVYRCCAVLQPPPSPDGEWDSEEDEEDGIAEQEPLDISWLANYCLLFVVKL